MNIFRLNAAFVLSALLSGVVPLPVSAQTADAMFELHPRCFQREGETDDWALGPIPAVGMIADTRGPSTRCTTFEVRDPQTLQTEELAKGETLAIDILIDNPSKQRIRRARAWLSYDPELLEGVSVQIDRKFPIVTPNEQKFSPEDGYVQMEATSEGSGPNSAKMLFATVEFRVLKTNAIGTPITFYNAEPSGHTVIMAAEGDEEAYIQKAEPGVLLVRFRQDATDTEEEDTSTQNDSIFDDPGAPVTTEQGQGQELLPNGARCTENSQCASGICGSGICVPDLLGTTGEESTDGRTAFSLLQIRNLRATTDDSSIFLAWDHLRSSQLKAYNVYYGTTSGRYIQRRTIDKSENSIVLRSLPEGTRYFLAVRGLSTQNEESAFSKEVSVVVGDPSSSTSPLLDGMIPRGSNPIGSVSDSGGAITVPGETGAPSVLLLFIILSGVIGTTFASRRQLHVTSQLPSND